MKKPRILLADDHRMLSEGLARLLTPEFDLVGIVENGEALLEATRKFVPDVIVSDISMPGLSGIDAVATLKKEGFTAKVIFLTMHQNAAYARRALEAGASGFVLKHSAPAELVTAIRAALAGETYLTATVAREMRGPNGDGSETTSDPCQRLTPRQRQILQLLAEGLSAKEIGASIGISARTVEFHKYRMMESLSITNSAALVQFALKQGLVGV